MQPPPLYKDGEFNMQLACLNKRLTTMFFGIQSELGLPRAKVINLFKLMGGDDLTMPELFEDGCHPND